MKHTTKLILPAVLIFALSLTGCPQAGTNPGENSGTNPAVPSNPNELVESDVLTAFGLQRGSVTASAAAKKIATGAPASDITFTERTAVSYDDQAGTFTVKVKGIKNGKPFEKTLNLTGFTHPLKDKLIQSLNSCELNLDEGIEHNYSLAKYITEVNKNPSGAKLVKKLSFLLTDNTTIELGEHDGYTLTTKAQAADTRVWVRPSVKVVFRKLTEGGMETLTSSMPFGFTHLKTQLTKDYFTEQDVFKYILDKTADIAIKVESTEFASFFYAGAKSTGQAPADLFTDAFKAEIKKYTDLYQTRDTDELLAIDKITYGIAQPKNGGIDADDYTGTVTVDLCIATSEQVTAQTGITAIKQIKKSGFVKITNANELNQQVFFTVISAPNPSPADVQAWKEKSFENYPLLRVDNNNGTITPNPITNPLPGGSGKPFQLCVNGTDNLASQLGCRHFGASLTKNRKSIFIENIVLDKKLNETDLKITVQLKGSGPFLTIITKPGPGY